MVAETLTGMYRRWLLEVWGAGRYEVADELLHIDLVDHNRLEGQPAGRAGDVWAAEMIRRAFPDLRFVADVVVSDGEHVVGRWTMTGTNTGSFELFGLPPTGRPVTMTGQEIFRADGKQFVEVWHQETRRSADRGSISPAHPLALCRGAHGGWFTRSRSALRRRPGACRREEERAQRVDFPKPVFGRSRRGAS